MKILLSVLHFGQLRNFESVVQELVKRGHEVLLLADEQDSFGGQQLAESLAQVSSVQWAWAPSYANERWFAVEQRLRWGLDYLRFLEAPYQDFPKLRDRAEERAPWFVVKFVRLPVLRSKITRWFLKYFLECIQNGLPRLQEMDEFLASERPAVALFVSVTNQRAPQLDHLRSARSLGIPTGVCVYSWDHLSSKTLIRDRPDRVFVWNDKQRQEAIELHRLPEKSIVVTGAQVYDQWFDRKPSRSRESFLRDVGLPHHQQFILYVCSAFTPDPGEPRFVRRWAEAIRRQGDSSLRKMTLLIRPHPERAKDWRNVQWNDLGPIAICGDNPITARAKSDYFDALIYSEAVVGLVTSAFLEAAIVGRPVLTITSAEFHAHQLGMLHFRYLVEVAGGLLKVAEGLEAHVGHLQQVLAGDSAYMNQQKKFLREFVRPSGLDVSATPKLASAIEELGSIGAGKELKAVPAWQRAFSRYFVKMAQLTPFRSMVWGSLETAKKRERDNSVRENRGWSRSQWRAHLRQKIVTRFWSRVLASVRRVRKFAAGRRKWWTHRGRKFIRRHVLQVRRILSRLLHMLETRR